MHADPLLDLDAEARLALVDVTVRYCWAIDERDWATLGSVFTKDAEVDYGFRPTLSGREAVQAYVEKVVAPLDRTQHLVTNHQFERVDGELRSRCYFQAQHVRRGLEGGENYIIAGIYRDAWSETEAGWQVHARTLEVLWTDGNPAVVGRIPKPD